MLTRNDLEVAYGIKPFTLHEVVRIVPYSTPTNKPSLSGYRFAVQVMNRQLATDWIVWITWPCGKKKQGWLVFGQNEKSPLPVVRETA